MREFTSVRDEGTTDDPNPLEGLSFKLDGQVFTCGGRPRLLDESELALLAVQATDIRTPQARAAVAAFLQMALGPVEYQRFRAHYHEHETPDEVLLDVLALINDRLDEAIAELTGRPTRPRLSSSPGPQDPDERTARVISLQAGDVTVVDEPGKADPDMPGGPATVKVSRQQPGSRQRAGSGKARAGRRAG
jgi:hypothetical protein